MTQVVTTEPELELRRVASCVLPCAGSQAVLMDTDKRQGHPGL